MEDDADMSELEQGLSTGMLVQQASASAGITRRRAQGSGEEPPTKRTRGMEGSSNRAGSGLCKSRARSPVMR